MKYLLAIFLLYPLGILAQLGIKTRPMHSLNLVHNNSEISDHHYQNTGNVSRQPPAYNNYHNHLSTIPIEKIPINHHQQTTVPLDKTMKFLNETRSKMANGVCYIEVPTISLLNDRSQLVAGNGSDPSLSKIRVCCDGYERNIHNFLQCDPICKNGCINGMCVAPDVCVCYPDHVRNYAGFCLATCPIGCGNGECQPDNTCLCKPGYMLDGSSKKFCAPVCSKGCRHNGNCTAPEVCECQNGYELNQDGVCSPKCDHCQNGQCIEPNVCRCLSGYENDRDGCKPICTSDCKNGFCAAPNVCACHPGWTLDNTNHNCIAHCEQPCLNGYCSASNVCSCHNGYIQDEFNPNNCQPHCAQGCPNGICTAPNYCICKAGFRKSGIKGRQQCLPV